MRSIFKNLYLKLFSKKTFKILFFVVGIIFIVFSPLVIFNAENYRLNLNEFFNLQSASKNLYCCGVMGLASPQTSSWLLKAKVCSVYSSSLLNLNSESMSTRYAKVCMVGTLQRLISSIKPLTLRRGSSEIFTQATPCWVPFAITCLRV